MTDDARLQALYRRLTAQNAAAPDADSFAQSLDRAGWPDEEGTPLDRIAASARDADLLRVALALAPDAAALQREVAQLRAPRRRPAVRWLAAAASVGAVAVLVGMLAGRAPQVDAPTSTAASSAPDAASAEKIWTGSFELAPVAATDAEAPIFAASFDS